LTSVAAETEMCPGGFDHDLDQELQYTQLKKKSNPDELAGTREKQSSPVA